MTSTVISSSIPRAHLDLAAHLHVPDGFDDHRPHAAVVISTPGSSVTEQIGADYARRLADRGFVAVTFDPAFQGESGASRAISRTPPSGWPTCAPSSIM